MNYNIVKRINGDKKYTVGYDVDLDNCISYLRARLAFIGHKAVSIDYVEGDHLYVVDNESVSQHWNLERVER